MEHPIDFVVTWLDSSDSEWQKQYLHYKQQTSGRTESARFRNMDIFRYWFRSVEKYAPWVNKVYLVTNGTFPKWINPNHPKLVLVKHSDYIPQEYLPTFNSRTIELYMNKIEGLSEHFVYFNDDMFINAPITPEYYFRNGLPCDNNSECVTNVPVYNEKDKLGTYPSILTDIGVINAHFNRWEVVKRSPQRWFGIHLGIRGLFLTLFLAKSGKFVGFHWRHYEQPYLKSVFDEAWEKEPLMLYSSSTRFRQETTLNPYFFRYWQFATNKFYPMKLAHGKVFSLRKEKMGAVEEALHSSSIYSICLNDTANCPDDEFVDISSQLIRLLNEKFDIKSDFEK